MEAALTVQKSHDDFANISDAFSRP